MNSGYINALKSYRPEVATGRTVDGHHRKMCARFVDDFHLESQETCICKLCGKQLEWFPKCVTEDTTTQSENQDETNSNFLKYTNVFSKYTNVFFKKH